jgi:CRP-like cAMP-binding protein
MQTVRMATASAISDCAVLRIQRKEILRVLHQERAFSDTFVAYLLLSHFGKKDRPETVIPEVSQVLHD